MIIATQLRVHAENPNQDFRSKAQICQIQSFTNLNTSCIRMTSYFSDEAHLIKMSKDKKYF